MNNVTPIQNGDEPPQQKRSARRRPDQLPSLSFARGSGEPSTFNAFTALKGVCHALDSLEGCDNNLDQYVRLSIAAAILVDILEERQLSRP